MSSSPALRFLRLGAIRNAVSQSLFFLPSLMVAMSVAMSQAAVWVDRQIGDDVLPSWFGSTVESSRSILSAVAGGTITAASIVFSLTLVAVQLAASQFSPRVLRGFLGDRFQQVVMGTVVGTFTYSLFVLRDVQSAGESGRGAFSPQISIALALVLAVCSLVAVLASIDHTAKGLRVGSVADNILGVTLDAIDALFVERRSDGSGPLVVDAPVRSPAPATPDADAEGEGEATEPPDDAAMLPAPKTGWITGMQIENLAGNIPEGASVLLPAAVGTYVVEGTPLLYVWPAGRDGLADVDAELSSIIRIGDTRTMQQDVGFGIVQLVDIAVRALSPGVNDPNTANEVIVRLGAVLIALYRRTLPEKSVEIDGRRVMRPDEPDIAGYVEAAIEPIRHYARSEPRVLAVLARTIVGVIDDARRRFDDPDVSALVHQLEAMRNEVGELATESDRERLVEVLGRLLHEVR